MVWSVSEKWTHRVVGSPLAGAGPTTDKREQARAYEATDISQTRPSPPHVGLFGCGFAAPGSPWLMPTCPA